MKEIRLKESFAQGATKLRHDHEKGIVYDVMLVPFRESFHKRIYDKSCSADVNKFHGVMVNVDHQECPTNAPFAARFGRFFNPKIGTDGIYGDLKYNPKHQFADQFKWWVDNEPSAVGFSLNALAKPSGMRDKKMVIGGFTKVDSIDLVGDPALSKGIFESKMEQQSASPLDEENNVESPNEVADEGPSLFDEALAKLAEAAVLEAGKLNCSDCARKVRAIADLLDDMEGGDSEEGDKVPEDEETQEKPMKESKDQNDEKAAAQEKRIASLESELNEIRTRESKVAEFAKRKLTMKQKCIEAKLDAKIVSDTFIETLASQDSDEVVTRLIEDRREFATPKKEETIVSTGKGINSMSTEALNKTLLGV